MILNLTVQTLVAFVHINFSVCLDRPDWTAAFTKVAGITTFYTSQESVNEVKSSSDR